MRYRIVFALVSLLFIAMNVALWRWHYAGAGHFQSAVAMDALWQKVVLAQDSSSLAILHEGQRIGFCTWKPSVDQARGGQGGADDMSVEEMTRKVTGYAIDLDGHFLVDDTTRIRFNGAIKLDTNFHWKELGMRFALRPDSWEFNADATKGLVEVTLDDDFGRRRQTFKFADLEHPDRIARRLGLGAFAPLVGAVGWPGLSLGSTNLLAGVTWQARRDRLTVGAAEIPVVRVQALLFQRPQITAFIGSFGEVFRVELPGDVLLAGDSMNLF